MAVDTPLGRITYTHTPGDKLGAGNLIEVQAPGEVARRYVYLSDPALLAKGRRHAHLLTGIVALVKSGNGQIIEQPYATYGYDEQGRADYTARTPLEGGKVESTRLEFRNGETVITDEAGRQTRTKHTVVGDDYRLLEVTGPGCSLCPDAGWRYEWLPNGRLQQRTQLDAQGRTLARTKFTYDAQARTLREERFKGESTTPTRVVRYEYEGTHRLPSKIITPSVVAGQSHVLAIQYNSRGQPIEVTQSGWAPAIAGVSEAQAISRTVKYSYRVIDGKSVVAQIEGPGSEAGATPVSAGANVQ